MKTPLILALIFAVQLLAACSGTPQQDTNSIDAAANSTKTQDPTEVANDNADEFGMLVNLPFEPTEVLYRESPNAAGARSLRAVIRFASEDANKITAGNDLEATTLSPEAWFPTELISQSELDLTSQLLKGKRFSAGEFIKPPYSAGTIVRIDETDYFILDLSAN